MHNTKKGVIISFSIILIFLLVMNFMVLNKLIALPSPLYGGDYYYQLGQTNHVKYGGSPFESSTINGALPGYFVTYSAISGYMAMFFNIDGITAEFLLSYLIIIASAIIIYALTFKLYKNIFVSSLSTLMIITPISFPIIKYTVFAHFVMMPLLLLSIYIFMEKKSLTSALSVGVIYGLIGLTHSVAFISSTFLLIAFFIYYALVINKVKLHRIWSKTEFSKIKNFVFSFLIIFGVGVLIAMLWWFKPIFIFHGETSPNYSDWNSESYSSLANQISFIGIVLQTLFNFTTLVDGVFSIFFLLGVVGIFLFKKDSDEKKFLRFLIVTSLIISLHYLLTENLIHTNFIPAYIIYLLLVPAKLLVGGYGIYLGYVYIKEYSPSKIFVWTYFSIIAILLIIGHFALYQNAVNNRWYTAGTNPLPDPQIQLKEYLVKNTDVTDTILTTKEVGFGLNALSGRKLVIVRRAQNDPFLDMDPRELDAAIILYGNNIETKKELIKKYGIKYVYWDYYWIQSEYNFDEQGRVTGWFDPLMMFHSAEKERILKNNNVSYFIENTWVDPALKGDKYKKFDLIFISPQNYRSQDKPWNSNLDQYLTEVWAYDYQGSKIAVLYRIDID